MQLNFEISVSATSLLEQDQVALNTAVKLLRLDGKSFQIFDNLQAAHLVIIDGDTDQGTRILTQSRPGQVKLVFSNQQQAGKNVITLKKPVSLNRLKDVMARLFEKMQAQLGTHNTRPTRVGVNSVRTESLLTETLFHVLFTAKENRDVLHLSNPDFADIFIDGVNRSLATSNSHEQIRDFIRLPIQNIVVNKMAINSFAVHSSELNISSLYNMLWEAALECSHGQLIPGLTAETPIRLRAWPNFTRNGFKPEHLKLAAVMAQQPVKISQLESLTSVPFESIVNFCNAAWAVDLLDKVSNENVMPIKRKKPSTAKKSLLSKIADRLGFSV